MAILKNPWICSLLTNEVSALSERLLHWLSMLWFHTMLSIYLSIYISTYIAPLQGNYSEALPAQARPKRRVRVSPFVKLSCSLLQPAVTLHHPVRLHHSSSSPCLFPFHSSLDY